MTPRKHKSRRHQQTASRSWIRHPWIVTLAVIVALITGLILMLKPTGTQGQVEVQLPAPTIAADLSPEAAEALTGVAEALAHVGYGFEPLLVSDEARIFIEDEIAYLTFPPQPDDPTKWSVMDCFAFAYGVRYELLNSPVVEDVTLGEVTLPAPRGEQDGVSTHVAAWVTFTDGSKATVDLTPLADGILANHTNPRTPPASSIEAQFDSWQKQVPLRRAQPMLVTERDGKRYYLLAGILVMQNEYHVTLVGYEYEPATATEPLKFNHGTVAGVRLPRTGEFENVKQLIVADGPQAFNNKPKLIIWNGDNDPALRGVLSDHLYLLWHLITKLEHRQPGIEAGESVRIKPVSTPPGATPEADPHLTIQLDIRDVQTEQPVAADVWVTIDGEDTQVAQASELVSLELPGKGKGVIIIKAVAPGYRPWAIELRSYQVKFDRVLPIPVQLEK